MKKEKSLIALTFSALAVLCLDVAFAIDWIVKSVTLPNLPVGISSAFLTFSKITLWTNVALIAAVVIVVGIREIKRMTQK